MHFGDMKQIYRISIMFDVLADHKKNLLIQMCRVELQVGLSIYIYIYIYIHTFLYQIYLYLLSFHIWRFF